MIWRVLGIMALASVTGPAWAEGDGSCATTVVTAYVYPKPSTDLLVAPHQLDRLNFRVHWRGLPFLKMAVSVTLEFDDRPLATFGYGDQFTYDASDTLSRRFTPSQQYQGRVDDVLVGMAKHWKAVVARAMALRQPVTMRFQSGGPVMEQLLRISGPEEIVLDARRLELSWDHATDNITGWTLLLLCDGRPVAIQRTSSNVEYRMTAEAIQRALDDALGKQAMVRVTVREDDAASSRFSVSAVDMP